MNAKEYKKPTINLSRFKWVYLIIILVFLYYAAQLFNYQIVDGETYVARAEDNRTTIISIPTQRGMIYDRNGIVLARNAAQYNVTVTPAELPDSAGEIRRIFDQLSVLVDIPVNQGEVNDQTAGAFTPCYTSLGIFQIVEIAESLWPFQATRLKCNLDKETAMIIEEKAMDWPGIAIETESVREYPTGETTAEMIGFLGPIPEILLDYYTELGFVSGRDKVGYMGIENSMQEELAGRNGQRLVEVTVGGEVVRDIEVPVEPVPGNDIFLSIDYRMQTAARAILEEQMRYWNAFYMREQNKILSTTGVVVGMNAKTGELLFMVSVPSYENNRMAQFIPGYYYEQLSIDDAKPLVNKAISSELPPGSVFKLVPALGVLNEDIVTPEQQIGCTPTITLRNQFYETDIGFSQTYFCHDDNGHGPVDYIHGIGYSCNVYWYKTSGGYPGEVEDGGLGIWNIYEYGAALGYGQETGIELPGEADGLLPNPTWKRLNQGENWATGDTYLAGVGQGYVLATPVQVMNAFSTIVNGGNHMQLTMINKIVGADGQVVKQFSPEVLWNITTDPMIHAYQGNNQTDQVKAIEPWVLDLAMRGMEVVTGPEGTARREFVELSTNINNIAGKTGTAEYCDDWANSQGLCNPAAWPSHAWFAGYAPADDPEIVVVAFVYNGNEGSTVSGPIVKKVIDAYFEFKKIDAELEGLQTGN